MRWTSVPQEIVNRVKVDTIVGYLIVVMMGNMNFTNKFHKTF
jgi:hypothetical protein